MNDKIFKEYDIRGIYNKDMDRDDFFKIGRGTAAYFQETNKDLSLGVSGDMRESTPIIKQALIEGLTQGGIEVFDMGMLSTPSFYFGVGMSGLDGGLQVTASHNPKEYNGMKVVKARAYPVGLHNGLDRILDYAKQSLDLREPAKIQQLEDITDAFAKYAVTFSGIGDLSSYRIVADTANGMGGPDLEALFEYMPGELIKMNFELDGNFPVHIADPLQDETLNDLKRKVVDERADLGIANDGDADRVFFIDEKGRTIEQSIIRGLLAQEVLRKHPGANIGYDIRPGKVTYDMITEAGGNPFVTKVGHANIKLEALKYDSPFSGESSGHFFFKTDYGTFDAPIIATAMILGRMQREQKPLSEIIRPYQRYSHSGEINNKVDDTERVLKRLEEKYSSGEINKFDGITVNYDDWWFNVRTSNTEPLIRLNLEAITEETMNKKRDEVLNVITS